MSITHVEFTLFRGLGGYGLVHEPQYHLADMQFPHSCSVCRRQNSLAVQVPTGSGFKCSNLLRFKVSDFRCVGTASFEKFTSELFPPCHDTHATVGCYP